MAPVYALKLFLNKKIFTEMMTYRTSVKRARESTCKMDVLLKKRQAISLSKYSEYRIHFCMQNLKT